MSAASPEDLSRAFALADFVANLHERGAAVHDPSPSVLQWTEGRPLIPDSEVELRSHGAVPKLAVAQLWSLLFGLSPRLKLLAGRAYCERRGISVDLDRALNAHTLGEIERCFHRNRDFKVVQAGGMIWHVRRDLFRDSQLVVLEDPDSFLLPGAKLLKDGRGTTVAEVPGGAVLKRFNLKKYRNILKHQFAASRARLAYQRAYHLEMMGIRTPRAIAFADRTTLGMVHRSYLLVEHLPDVTEGHKALAAWSENADARKRRALADAGALIGRLHGAGFANRDLKAANLLATHAGEVWLVDLDGVRHSGRVNPDVRVKNLRRMVRDLPSYGGLSLRDMMSFLRHYVRASRHPAGVKELFRRLSRDD